MATWHQRKNPVPCWHPTLWTYVEEKDYHSFRSHRLYKTEREAEEMRKRMGYGFVVAPYSEVTGATKRNG